MLNAKQERFLNRHSYCFMYPTADGRVSIGSTKVAYAYQIVALKKFGRKVIESIPARKDDC